MKFHASAPPMWIIPSHLPSPRRLMGTQCRPLEKSLQLIANACVSGALSCPYTTVVFTHSYSDCLYLLCSDKVGIFPAFSWMGLPIFKFSPPICLVDLRTLMDPGKVILKVTRLSVIALLETMVHCSFLHVKQ